MAPVVFYTNTIYIKFSKKTQSFSFGKFMAKTRQVLRCQFAGCLKSSFFPVGQKHSDARRAKSRGMRRTLPYVAMTRDERNAADGCFSTAG
jgi:hypothetical protein